MPPVGSAPHSLEGARVGSYTIDELIRSGAMGAVYRATGPGGRRYAMKILRGALASAILRERFSRESKIAFAVESPHLVPVSEAGSSEFGPYIVMPLLDGKDLDAWLVELGQLPPDTATRIAIHACRGLAALHAANIIHRDVKPSNLFLSNEPDRSLLVRICDYGIAKELTSHELNSLTETGTGLGSPYYLSPEQARDSKRVDDKSDIWSLGVVLFRMLAGRLPYDKSAGITPYLLALIDREPGDVRDFAPWVGPQLSRVVTRALKRDPLSRHASVKELERALSACIGSEPILRTSMLVSLSDAERKKSSESAPLSPRAEGFLQKQHALVGRELAERYRVVRLLGRGGMSTVWEATTRERKRVAVKVIEAKSRGAGTEALDRFLREAQAALSIHSPNVVQTFDVDYDDELAAPLIVMELLNGTDLNAVYATRGALEPSMVARVFAQAARGIAAAHAKGIVHRDIKPANLFLHRGPDRRLSVKVCDFGIAKRRSLDAFDDERNQAPMLGSPLYMSPEQAVNAKDVDARTDVWSLCASAYQGLCGEKLWGNRSTVGELMLAICTEPVPAVRDNAPWVDAALAHIVDKGLSRKPSERWPSMDALARALSRYAGDPDDIRVEQLTTVDRSRTVTLAKPRPLDELAIRAADGSHCVAVWRNMLVSAWRDGASVERLLPVQRLLRELVARNPEGVVFALRWLSAVPIPEGEPRALIIEMMREFDRDLRCWTIVIEGEGFRAAAARTAAATLRLMARASFPLTVSATTAEAASWLAAHTAANASEVEGVLERVAQGIKM